MNPILKQIIAVIGGIVVGMIVIGLTEGLGHLIFPPPAGLDLSDMEQVASYMPDAPIISLLWVALAWVVGTFVGGAIATMIGKEFGRTPAYFVGGILSLSGILNLVKIPHPTWFWISILVFIPAALIGRKVVADRRA